MPTKRQKNGLWEYVVKRKRLGVIYYTTYPLDKEEEGDREIARIEAQLDLGIIPPEILCKKGPKLTTAADLIRLYLTKVVMSESDKSLLKTLSERVAQVKLEVINYRWLEQWVLDMKVIFNLKPGTIRHYVGALGRCFDWAIRSDEWKTQANPVKLLPRNYAKYSSHDITAAKKFDPLHVKQEDEERDRRLEDREEENIRAVLGGMKRHGRERALQLKFRAALELLMEMGLETAMRLQEMFTLTLDQIDMRRKTIFLQKTKNGNKRQIPLTSVIISKIKHYLELVRHGKDGMDDFTIDDPEGRIFPWWNGDHGKKALSRVSSMLSQQFARIFDAAGCADLRFHDFRHEATSRFFERTEMQDFEIMKITGHSSTRMLKRYSNLRGSVLANKMW